jgi:hypothetical protein
MFQQRDEAKFILRLVHEREGEPVRYRGPAPKPEPTAYSPPLPATLAGERQLAPSIKTTVGQEVERAPAEPARCRLHPSQPAHDCKHCRVFGPACNPASQWRGEDDHAARWPSTY